MELLRMGLCTCGCCRCTCLSRMCTCSFLSQGQQRVRRRWSSAGETPSTEKRAFLSLKGRSVFVYLILGKEMCISRYLHSKESAISSLAQASERLEFRKHFPEQRDNNIASPEPLSLLRSRLALRFYLSGDRCMDDDSTCKPLAATADQP